MKRSADALRARNAELERSSRTDVLTGLPNRRDVEERLVSQLSSAERHGHHVGVPAGGAARSSSPSCP